MPTSAPSPPLSTQSITQIAKILSSLQTLTIIITIGNLTYSFATKRTPVSYTTFVIPPDNPYLTLKYQHSQFQIYMVCLIAQVITLLTSLLGLFTLMPLAKIHLFSCYLYEPSKLKMAILYLTIVLSIQAQIIVFTHFLQIKIQLTVCLQNNLYQQLVIAILSAINLLILITILTAFLYLQFHKLQNRQKHSQFNQKNPVQTPKNIATLKTILDKRLLDTEVNILSNQLRHNERNTSSKRHIKSTIPPKNVVLNHQFTKQQSFQPIVNPQKQPLLQINPPINLQQRSSDFQHSSVNNQYKPKYKHPTITNKQTPNIQSPIDLSNLSISIIKSRVQQQNVKNQQKYHSDVQNKNDKQYTNTIDLKPIQNDRPTNQKNKIPRLNLKDIKNKIKKQSSQHQFHAKQILQAIYTKQEVNNNFSDSE